MKALYKISIVAIAAIAIVLGTFIFVRLTSPFVRFGNLRVGEKEVGILFLGDSAFVIRTAHHTIIIDPATKISPDSLGPLGKIDAILITHEHSDHFDARATFDLHHASEAVVIANTGAYQDIEGMIHRAEKRILMRPGEVANVDGIMVSAMASNHSGVTPLVYVIEMDNITIFHGSDSGFTPDLVGFLGKVDIALLPTGGASPTASPSQAFQMAEALLPRKAIPMHGTSGEYAEFGSLLASLPQVSFTEIKTSDPQIITLP
jgi:L-ascorbate metabolism protein UlaG (beta-lactamase superfamily)